MAIASDKEIRRSLACTEVLSDEFPFAAGKRSNNRTLSINADANIIKIHRLVSQRAGFDDSKKPLLINDASIRIDDDPIVGNKWLDLLKEIAPGLTRVGVMFNPDTSPQSKFFMRSIEAAAPSLGVQASVIPVRATADIEPAFERFAHVPNGGLILPTDSFTILRIELIADLAARHRLPSISALDRFPKVGGLMYYGVQINSLDQFQQAASYVDRILKGAKPGDLPIQGADKYTLIINLKVAKALGLTVPLPLAGLADELIE